MQTSAPQMGHLLTCPVLGRMLFPKESNMRATTYQTTAFHPTPTAARVALARLVQAGEALGGRIHADGRLDVFVEARDGRAPIGARWVYLPPSAREACCG